MWRKRFLSLVILCAGIVTSAVLASNTYAQSSATAQDCALESVSPSYLTIATPETFDIVVKTKGPCFEKGLRYAFWIQAPGYDEEKHPISAPVNESTNELHLPLQYDMPPDVVGTWPVIMCRADDKGIKVDYIENCTSNPLLTTEIAIVNPDQLPTLSYLDQKICAGKDGDKITLTAKNAVAGQTYHWFYDNDFTGNDEEIASRKAETDGDFTFEVTYPPDRAYDIHVCIDVQNRKNTLPENCLKLPKIEEGGDTSCSIQNETYTSPSPPPHPPCPNDFITYSPGTKIFVGCGKLNTGLGVVLSTNPTEFISDIFGILLSISGGILLMLIIFSGYQMMTSQGDAEKIKAARERITSAIVGFAFLVFSMVILEVIGVDILRIPGFEKGSNTTDNQYNSIEEQRVKNNTGCGGHRQAPCTDIRTNNGCASGNILNTGTKKCERLRNPNGPQG